MDSTAGTGSSHTPGVSVIVPIYNGIRYIDQCAEFIKAQRFDDLELILSVDGRSDDGTVERARQLSGTDPRMKVIILENGNLAANRNIGLAQATGELVWFCDVDDAPSPDFIPVMRDLVLDNDADFAVCAYINTGPDGVVQSRKGGSVKIMDRDAAILSASRRGLPVQAWCKMFRRDFLLDKGLYFLNSRAEDVEHLYRSVAAAKRIAVTDRALYAYRLTPGSITRTAGGGTARAEDELQAYREADKIWKDHPSSRTILRHNALMRMRSSGHMALEDFLAYRRSEEAVRDHRTYFRYSAEGFLYYHFPRLYYRAINFYIRRIYRRNGSRDMRKLR